MKPTDKPSSQRAQGFTRAELAEFLAIIEQAPARDLARHQRRLEAAVNLSYLDASGIASVRAALDARRRVVAERGMDP